MKKIITFLVLAVITSFSFGQGKSEYITELEKKAENHFYNGEFKLAYKDYLKLWLQDSLDTDYNYKLAVSSIEENINAPKAIEQLLYVAEKDKSYENLCYYIGRAYMHCYKFTDAIKQFNQSVKECNDKKLLLRTERLISSCNNAIELLNNPVNVTFENLGSAVNSTKDDFTPFISPDESQLVFSSNKKYDPDYDTFIENIYFSEFKDGSWINAKNQSNINTADNEHVVSQFCSGDKILLCNNLDQEFSDILIAEKKGTTYKYNKNYDYLFNIMNTKQPENGGSMTDDEKTIFISGEREDGLGGSDIYIIRKLPDGNWSKAQNAGNVINSETDESFPNISPDGNILYFASKGHNSIGGYDIFVSYWNITRQEWTTPMNLGFPVNTSEDNLTISFSGNMRYAYISATRKEGFGGRDIYRITFEDAEKEYTLIKSQILSGDSINPLTFTPDPDNLFIEIYDSFGNLFGQYLPKKNTSEFIAILPVGKYRLEINQDGYIPLVQDIEIKGKSEFSKELNKKFYISLNK